MNNNELRQLEQGLAAAFPDWFRVHSDGEFSGRLYGRNSPWTPLDGSLWKVEGFKQICLNVANSQGWEYSVALYTEQRSVVCISEQRLVFYINFPFLNKSRIISWGEHQVLAIAVALALLEAHRKEQGK